MLLSRIVVCLVKRFMKIPSAVLEYLQANKAEQACMAKLVVLVF
jgi:hypothetical protein